MKKNSTKRTNATTVEALAAAGANDAPRARASLHALRHAYAAAGAEHLDPLRDLASLLLTAIDLRGMHDTPSSDAQAVISADDLVARAREQFGEACELVARIESYLIGPGDDEDIGQDDMFAWTTDAVTGLHLTIRLLGRDVAAQHRDEATSVVSAATLAFGDVAEAIGLFRAHLELRKAAPDCRRPGSGVAMEGAPH